MVTLEVPRSVLERLLTDYRTIPSSGPPGERAIALQHNLLPLFGDFMGWWGLRLDGTLWFVPEEEPSAIEPVEGHQVELRGIHCTFTQGARRYPELAPYIPKRGTEDPDCPTCKSSGALPGLPPNIVCECGGSGWLPRAAVRPVPPPPFGA